MIIDKTLFIDFLKKISLNGTVSEIVIWFDGDGMKSKVKNITNSVICVGLLKDSNFKNYTITEDKIGVKSVDKLLSILRKFDNEIKLNIVPSKAYISFSDDKRTIKYRLLEVEFVDSYVKKLPQVEIKNECKIPSTFLKNIRDVCSMYDVTIKFKVKDGILTCTVPLGMEEEYLEKENLDISDCSIIFGSPLLDIIPVLDDEIYLSLEQNMPMQIKMKDDNYFIKYIIAPRVGDD